jgi:tyrosyl-tRNA synthetase
VQTDLAASKAEARRLIEQGGVRLNGERVSEVGFVVDLDGANEAQLQVGKLRFLKVVFQK